PPWAGTAVNVAGWCRWSGGAKMSENRTHPPVPRRAVAPTFETWGSNQRLAFGFLSSSGEWIDGRSSYPSGGACPICQGLLPKLRRRRDPGAIKFNHSPVPAPLFVKEIWHGSLHTDFPRPRARLHADRAAGGDCHHWHPDRVALARRPEG